MKLDKSTEPAFSGEYDDHWAKGVYVCQQCQTPLYRSDDKFDTRLGHVFEHVGLTAKDTRHCVNSVSLKLIR